VTSGRGLYRQNGHVGRHVGTVGTLMPASSYHLGEGRYFEAPLILKQQKKSRKLTLLMTLGVSLSLIPTFKNQEIFTSFEEVGTVVLTRNNNEALSPGGAPSCGVPKDYQS